MGHGMSMVQQCGLVLEAPHACPFHYLFVVLTIALFPAGLGVNGRPAYVPPHLRKAQQEAR